MRIVIYSNAPWAPTGYGMQTLELAPRLKAAGHEVMVANNFGLQGAKLPNAGAILPELEGIAVWPAGIEGHSTALSPAHFEAWEGDWLLTLYDVWPLAREAFPERTVSWVPIDHQPVTPEVLAWCKTVRLIAMSRFGERMLRAEGLAPSYAPHSINTKVFYPRGRGMRKALDIPESAFLVIINAANKGVNPTRKSWPDMFRVLAYFQREHPDTHIYVHTDPARRAKGVDLQRLAKATGLQNLVWADAYAMASGDITPDDLAGYYSMGDVLLSPSMGEGFGIPVIEAQACGLPVIVSDFSAQPELVGAGWTVRGQPWWDEAQGSDLFTPYIGDMAGRLTDAYESRGDNGLRERAVAFAAGYESDLVFERHWRPILAELEASMRQAPVEAVAPRNRAERRAAKKRRKAA